MPYIMICRADPDDGLWHEPTANRKTSCGKNSSKPVRTGVQVNGRLLYVDIKHACHECYRFVNICEQVKGDESNG